MITTAQQKYRIEDHPHVAFAWANIEEWDRRMPALAKQWDRAANMYAMRDTPRTGGVDGVTKDTESDILEAGSAELYGFVDTLVATIVPPKPAADIKTLAGNDRFRDQAKARSAVVKEDFRKAKVAKKLRKSTTRACVYPRAFLKAVHVDRRNKPVRPGCRVLKPHAVYFDQTVEEWEDVRWLCEVVPRTRAEIEAGIGGKGRKKAEHPYRATAAEDLKHAYDKYPEHLAHVYGQKEDGREASLKLYHWVTTYEYYDFVGGKFYIFAKGVDEPLYESDLPYVHLPNPYYLITFHDNLVDVGGMGDADLVIRMIDNLNNFASLELQYAAKSIPREFIDTGKFEDPTRVMDDYENADGAKAIIEATMLANFKLSDAVYHTQTPTLPIEWDKSKAEIYDRIRHILAIHPIGRGQVGNVEVATEASLADAAIKNRNQPREEVINDAIAWLADACLAIRRQFMQGGDPLDLDNPPEQIPVPVQGPGGEEAIKSFTKRDLGLEEDDEPFAFQVEAHPYDAMAEDDVAQLRKMEKYLPYIQMFVESGLLDAKEVAKSLAEMLHFPEWLAEEQPQQGGVPGVPGGTPGVPNVAGPSTEEQMAGGEVMDGSGGLSGGEMAPDAPGIPLANPE